MVKTLLLSILLLVANYTCASEPNKDSASAQVATAVFAGGCFWCMEKPYDAVDGVLKTESGYTGGKVDNPSYQQVSAGGTGHYEALRVTYDPVKVSYEKLLEVFWKNVDPFDSRGQFCDKGQQYQAVIFTATANEKNAAQASLAALQQQFGEKKIVTEILPVATFYPAEDYHQDYYLKNPVRYKYYRFSCGRDQRLQQIADSLKK